MRSGLSIVRAVAFQVWNSITFICAALTIALRGGHLEQRLVLGPQRRVERLARRAASSCQGASERRARRSRPRGRAPASRAGLSGAAATSRPRSRSSARGRAWSACARRVDHAIGVRHLGLTWRARLQRHRAGGRLPPLSRITCLAGLSLRRPTNLAWRMLAVGCPVGEHDLGHQLRLDPALGHAGAARPALAAGRVAVAKAVLGVSSLTQALLQVAPPSCRTSRCRRCPPAPVGPGRRARRAAGCRSPGTPRRRRGR